MYSPTFQPWTAGLAALLEVWDFRRRLFGMIPHLLETQNSISRISCKGFVQLIYCGPELKEIIFPRISLVLGLIWHVNETN